MTQGQAESPTIHGAIYNPSQSLHLKQKQNSKAIFVEQIKPKNTQNHNEGYSADYELKITIL